MRLKAVLLIISISLLISAPAYSGKSALIDTKVKTETTYYPWVTFLSQGHTIWTAKAENEEIQGHAYRVAITTAEIYNGIYIERITIGREGCCKKIASIWKLNREMFGKVFNMFGEFSGLKFTNWHSPTSFEFSMHTRSFLMEGLGNVKVKITEIKK